MGGTILRDFEKTIIHVDCNYFYACVEELYHPEFRGKPMAVGGDAEARHGIILTKNPEAKAFGVQTGEALWQAKQKCPRLIIVKPNYRLYQRFSRLARAIYSDYTPTIQSFGLDECWLDVTGCTHLFGNGEQIAHTIRERIKRELGITVSVGVSWNKIFSKLGSDYKKPDAVTVITPDNFKEIVWPLPVGDLLYVGPATKQKLRSKGIMTIGDLARTKPDLLDYWFGKIGLVIYRFANGYDTSPVEEGYTDQSVGNSQTTPRDLICDQDAKIIFYMLAESVASRLREGGFLGTTVQIGVRDNELQSFQRQMKITRPTCLSNELCDTAMKLLKQNHDWSKPLRSIGVRACNLIPATTPEQLTLLEDENQRKRREQLERTVDDIRRRFGHYSIGRAINSLDPTLGRINPKADHTIHPVGYFNAN